MRILERGGPGRPGILLRSLMVPVTVLAAATQASAAPTPDAVDAVVRAALRAWLVPGAAVAVVHKGEVVYLKGHGVKELGRRDPVTPDSLFPIASCTKGFTTTAMAMLVDEGKMAWDDPVRKYLPSFRLSDPLVDASVTLRDLVCHRTGVRSHDFLWYRAPWGPEESVRRLALVPVDLPFRASFQYQSTMFTAAGHAVGAASGRPWEEFVHKRIFEPLGMTSATTTTPPAEKSPDHASGQRRKDNGELEVVPWYTMSVPDPAGSICASARDLAKWVGFQAGDGSFQGKRLVTARAFAEVHTPQNLVSLRGTARDMNPDTLQMSYGMAWVIHDHRGHLLYSHAGAIDGFRAHFTIVPREQLGIVLLNNLQFTRMNLALCNSLLDLYLGMEPKDWNRINLEQVRKAEAEGEAKARERWQRRHHNTRPSRELGAYAGAYEEPAYGTAKITLDNGSLGWSWSSFRVPLTHFHYDTFIGRDDVLGTFLVEFRLGADGNVAAVRITDSLDVEFRRIRQ